MRVLNVTMHGESSESRMLALPFDVLGPSGEPLGQGVVSPTRPARVQLSRDADDLPRVHVVAARPDGTQLQASARLQGGPNDATDVTLEAGIRSPREWLQWVTPFRSLDHLNTPVVDPAAPDRPRRVGKVWVTLWRLEDGLWRATDANPETQLRADGARLIVLDVPNKPHLLHVGGDEVAWRLISLPPGGQARVALTRRASEDGDSVDVTVGRLNPVNELIMSYLTRGDDAHASRLAEAWQAAEFALYYKMQDPVSAAAGAYVLFKMNRLEDRWQWVLNLVNWFEYLADGPILAAATELQRPEADLKRVRSLVKLAMERGLPVFSMGLSILVETMAAIHRGKRESKSFQMYYQAARAYLQARASKGAYLAYYGSAPAEPSPTRLFGNPFAPRIDNDTHRLGSGPRRIQPQLPGSNAFSVESSRTLSTNFTADLERMGAWQQHSRVLQDGYSETTYRAARPRRPGTSIQLPSNKPNRQWAVTAMLVFDGDE